MTKSLVTWKLISKSLKENIPVMLLYVLESSGSSPGRQGFFMAVNAHGDMEGSIGGGRMEHKLVEMAKKKLRQLKQGSGHKDKAASIKKQVHDKSASKNQSGMICSGEQTILLYPIQTEEVVLVTNIIASIEQFNNGTLTLSPGRIQFSNAVPEKDFDLDMQSESNWLYKEKTGYKNHLFIIGGGHCALALSRLMSPMDFYIHLYDDRVNLKTMQENDFAHEQKLVKDYSQLNGLIPSGCNHYVVIMTFGYRSDDVALRALLNKEFNYLGLLGSKTKIEKMFNDYRKEGMEENLLQSIYTPVGIPVKSQTPEEIAISIAAEIIRVKNEPGP